MHSVPKASLPKHASSTASMPTPLHSTSPHITTPCLVPSAYSDQCSVQSVPCRVCGAQWLLVIVPSSTGCAILLCFRAKLLVYLLMGPLVVLSDLSFSFLTFRFRGCHRIRRILAKYQGTHNYHNYTSKMSYDNGTLNDSSDIIF